MGHGTTCPTAASTANGTTNLSVAASQIAARTLARWRLRIHTSSAAPAATQVDCQT